MRATIVRGLAGSVLLSWPALHLADGLPPDHPLGGKADDLVTGAVVTLLLLGLLAAGWLRPLWAVTAAVLAFGTAVPHVYEAVNPRECPPGVSGMDCLPASYGALGFAIAGVAVVLLGAGVRLAAGAAAVPVRLGSPAA